MVYTGKKDVKRVDKLAKRCYYILINVNKQ